MKKYDILITETLTEIVEIEAANVNEAIAKVKEKYRCADIVLDSENYSETTFTDNDPDTYFSVAYAGECTKIHANDEQCALYQAQQDYQKPPTKRLLDWKDSEHTSLKEWDITAI